MNTTGPGETRGGTPPGQRRITPQVSAAEHFEVDPKTIANWVRAGYVVGYLDAEKHLHVDLNEVETALRGNRRMRDGRRSRFGPQARLAPLPVQVVRPTGGDS